MEDTTTLDRLPVGRQAAVAGLSAPESQRRRLLELGFVPGGVVSAVQESPWGDPVAYAVCGANRRVRAFLKETRRNEVSRAPEHGSDRGSGIRT